MSITGTSISEPHPPGAWCLVQTRRARIARPEKRDYRVGNWQKSVADPRAGGANQPSATHHAVWGCRAGERGAGNNNRSQLANPRSRYNRLVNASTYPAGFHIVRVAASAAAARNQRSLSTS